MPEHHKLDYVEFRTPDLAASKAFFHAAFGWNFVDYGPDYTAFSGEGLDGGLFRGAAPATADGGAPLLVFYSAALEGSEAAVTAAGGRVVREIFSFPGGRRFHFVEPGGNELAVWSDRDADG
ncbi:VOC family protein [Mangrovimicrobium sediminis]|uniref:VOC family protein n=1 Tax=Mangrovimicrobium sediminis TaxID=2562682 RepID=A0A4Z0M3X3_9GAMM|nr:VOC family protein [Haliea sp. SAOS-164]TGD74322.1 VOC family protein [Haliea sp. SAOS-164]